MSAPPGFGRERMTVRGDGGDTPYLPVVVVRDQQLVHVGREQAGVRFSRHHEPHTLSRQRRKIHSFPEDVSRGVEIILQCLLDGNVKRGQNHAGRFAMHHRVHEPAEEGGGGFFHWAVHEVVVPVNDNSCIVDDAAPDVMTGLAHLPHQSGPVRLHCCPRRRTEVELPAVVCVGFRSLQVCSGMGR